MKSKVLTMGVLLCLVVGLGILFRVPIMRSFANFLIVETSFDYVEYGFILSGGAFDRGIKAANLFHDGEVAHLVCTGGNQSSDIKALGIDALESDLTKLQLVKLGVPEEAITVIKKGTSTFEEAELILVFCKMQHLDSILVISSKFHTRRVHQVFTKTFDEEGISVSIQGASSSNYDELNWWKSEAGLIALNNEYLKQLYYLINH